MTREEAIKEIKSWDFLNGKEIEAVQTLIPELRESNEEEIRKDIIGGLMWQRDNLKSEGPHDNNLILPGFCLTVGKHLSYLEKQKENPKSADSISSDCTSSAKCEDRWHKVTDSLPDNGREVLAKDKLGNTLLARYDGDGWDVSVYDDEDYRCHNGISKWCEIPSEKQKDHFRDDTKMIELQDYYGLNDLERAIHRGFLAAGVENVPVTIIKETANECKRTQTIANENANAEWSEEDTLMLTAIIQTLETFGGRGTTGMQIAWLKSLRPQPHWKPSEEQLNALNYFIKLWGKSDDQLEYTKIFNTVKSLRDDLEKLM